MLDTCQKKKLFAILKASVKIKLSFKGQKLKLIDVHSFKNCEIPYFYFLDNFQYRRIYQKTNLTSHTKISTYERTFDVPLLKSLVAGRKLGSEL